MIDIINDPIGTKYGCQYSFTAATKAVNPIGTFSNLVGTANDGRCVKDPTTIFGYNFTGNVPDRDLCNIRSGITLSTAKHFRTNAFALGSGTEEVTKEQVDFTKYKEVIAFTTIGDIVLTAIPKDQLLVMKNPISLKEYINGINSISVTVTNAFAKFAVGDGTDYYTFDATTTSWSKVDLTHDTDTLKTEMMDYTVMNAITKDQYALQFTNITNFSLAMVIGINPTSGTTYDTTKPYTISAITVDYVGNNTAGPTNQYFNLVKEGYSHNGNPILIADRTIEQSISYDVLYKANMVFGGTQVKIPGNEIPYKMYIRLPKSSSDGSADEWDTFITNGPHPSDKSIEEYYNTEIPSLTSTIATLEDDYFTDPGTNTKIITRGGDGPSLRYNYGNTAYDANVGWRPVFEVDVNEMSVSKPSTVLTEVHSIKDLGIGKCINCDHIYSASGIGSFKNLGKAKLGLLTDYTNTTSGSFYFNCVGFNKDGEPICVADRPISTGMNYSTLVTGNTPDVTGYYGKEIELDGCKYVVRLMYINPDNEFNSDNEYAKFMTTLGTNKKFDEIWHTDKTLTVTNTILNSDTKSNMIIVRGLNDDTTRNTKKQRFFPYNTKTAEIKKLAFRPVIILKAQTHVESFEIIPYVAQEGNTAQDKYKASIIVLDDKNNLKEYKLASGGKDIKAYSTDTSFILDTKDFNTGATTIDIVVKEIDVVTRAIKEVTLKSFEIYKDAKRRTTTFRKFGEDYGGWNTDGSVDYHKTAVSTASSTNQEVTNYGTNGYINVNKFTTKVTFN